MTAEELIAAAAVTSLAEPHPEIEGELVHPWGDPLWRVDLSGIPDTPLNASFDVHAESETKAREAALPAVERALEQLVR